jgi:hypothetical protein
MLEKYGADALSKMDGEPGTHEGGCTKDAFCNNCDCICLYNNNKELYEKAYVETYGSDLF